MVRRTSNVGYAELHLPTILEPEVEAWSKQGWTGVTQTTHDLLSYWFNRDEETEERFYPCQQRAIETVIYCHEVLRIRTRGNLYELLAQGPFRVMNKSFGESDLFAAVNVFLRATR